MKIRTYLSNKYIYAALVLLLATMTQIVIYNSAHAGLLTNTLVRFDRLQASQPTTGTICAMPATTATEGKVLVTFPTGYSVSSTTGNWATSTTNLAWPSTAQPWTGSGTATSISGQTVTFPSGDLTVGTLYCFNWTNTNALSIGTAGTSQSGSVATQTTGGGAIDSNSYATSAVSNDTIAVTATVPQAFSFALGSNSDGLGSLSSSTVTTSGSAISATVNTNAKNGWSVWGYDQYTGVKSPNAGNYTIGSTTPGTNSTLSAGTEGYNLGITSSQTAGSGTITVAAPFVGGSLGKGGGLDTSLRTLASSTGTAQNGTLSLKNSIAISAITPPASDYTDTVYVVGAGLF